MIPPNQTILNFRNVAKNIDITALKSERQKAWDYYIEVKLLVEYLEKQLKPPKEE